jgi:hypothetical protein
MVLGAGNGLAHGQLHPRAVASYNLVHHFWIPMALITAASLDVIGLVWFIVGVTWCLHVALDRSLGYGLRDRDGFQRGR